MLRAISRLSLLSLVVLLSALSSPRPGGAIYHLALIEEVMSGVGGDPDAQYVEIRMEAPGQNFVDDTRLTIFNADGSAFTVLLLLQGNVPNSGTNLRWIMATQAFADLPQVQQAGFTPDFTFPPGILTPSGMVCWGAPDVPQPSDTWDPQFPFFHTDCVAYGGYTGGDSLHPPPSALPPGDGAQALQRIAPPPDADADAFELRCPTPENNAGQVLLLGADDDADGLPNCHEGELGTDPAVVDTDQDGCADGEEVGPSASSGGLRDPTNFWDFFDTPTGLPPARDKVISVGDIGAIVARFVTSGSETTVADALSPPPSSGYHAAFDRAAAPGKLSGPADGVISVTDIGLLVVQFVNTCSAPP